MELSERDKSILNAIINDYIETGEPVGSRTLSKKYAFDLSPASIRNVMADLDEMGLLKQPHASAGRIPTDRGYRFYVDSILKVDVLSQTERELIDAGYEKTEMEIPNIMKETSRILSLMTRYTAIVLAPRFSNAIFKHIEFIKLRENRILVILVSKAGLVQNKIIHVEEDIPQFDLDRYSRYLNEILENLTLVEVKERIIEEMRKEKVAFDKLFYKTLEMSKKAINGAQEGDIYIEGKEYIFRHREFEDIEKMRNMLKTFEEKHLLVKLLDKSTVAEEIQIFIGAENEFQEVQNCTLITSSFGGKGQFLGTLGVIGPTRMNYSRVIPIVDYTAKVVSKILKAN